MATVRSAQPELRIIPLASADLAGLDLLFEEQCGEWLGLLKWDYKGPSILIREVARQRNLSGFAAVAGSATIGFSFYVLEGGRCSIGDIYVSRPWRGGGVDARLAAAVIERAERLPRLRRIESQSLSIGNDGASEVFESAGFERFERLYMTVRLPVEPARSIQEPPGIKIRPWEEEDFARAASTIYRSYRGGHDARINSQYRTEEGCVELLSVLTDSIWCGSFLPHVSRVAVDRVTGEMVGVLIASRISRATGHIGQVSVLPAYQGRKIGRLMIDEALFEYGRRRFETVSLAVTTANEPALHLYLSRGFKTLHSFPVFFRERSR